jgi:hypothetical protein
MADRLRISASVPEGFVSLELHPSSFLVCCTTLPTFTALTSSGRQDVQMYLLHVLSYLCLGARIKLIINKVFLFNLEFSLVMRFFDDCYCLQAV